MGLDFEVQKMIMTRTLGDVICDNTDSIQELPENVFRKDARLIRCDDPSRGKLDFAKIAQVLLSPKGASTANQQVESRSESNDAIGSWEQDEVIANNGQNQAMMSPSNGGVESPTETETSFGEFQTQNETSGAVGFSEETVSKEEEIAINETSINGEQNETYDGESLQEQTSYSYIPPSSTQTPTTIRQNYNETTVTTMLPYKTPEPIYETTTSEEIATIMTIKETQSTKLYQKQPENDNQTIISESTSTQNAKWQDEEPDTDENNNDANTVSSVKISENDTELQNQEANEPEAAKPSEPEKEEMAPSVVRLAEALENEIGSLKNDTNFTELDSPSSNNSDSNSNMHIYL